MSIRVRFAPSPTGPLHIGGVRTALYNYLLARKHQGTFVLRIEDTDQNRYVDGAESYIIESLQWFGIMPDEGPGIGGEYGPYRQSERKSIYGQYAEQLVAQGDAYYAFDSAEDLDKMKADLAEQGVHSAKYDRSTRQKMKNSFTLSTEEIKVLKGTSPDMVIRLNVPEGETIHIEDDIRGSVSFSTDELDDKVILKADGMPTYHLANIVDDHLMKITHVIRGEEWLPSTAHHVLMYRYLGWSTPRFAHLPLILNPNGKGKLSKRHGAQFGFPVFPLEWDGGDDGIFTGFREEGFLPDAVINFLAFLGWNPGNNEEIFSVDELCQAFSVEQIVKSGARFDIDKALWYNQQYLINSHDDDLAELIAPYVSGAGYNADRYYLKGVCALMKERVHKHTEIVTTGYYFFRSPDSYDDAVILRKFDEKNDAHFDQMRLILTKMDTWKKEAIEAVVKDYIKENQLSFGAILPILRIISTGTMQGPDLFATLELLGKEETLLRWDRGIEHCKTLVTQV